MGTLKKVVLFLWLIGSFGLIISIAFGVHTWF